MGIGAAAKAATDGLVLASDVPLLLAVERYRQVFADLRETVRVSKLGELGDGTRGNGIDIERADVSANIELNRRFGVPASSHAGRVEIERFRLGYGITA